MRVRETSAGEREGGGRARVPSVLTFRFATAFETRDPALGRIRTARLRAPLSARPTRSGPLSALSRQLINRNLPFVPSSASATTTAVSVDKIPPPPATVSDSDARATFPTSPSRSTYLAPAEWCCEDKRLDPASETKGKDLKGLNPHLGLASTGTRLRGRQNKARNK